MYLEVRPMKLRSLFMMPLLVLLLISCGPGKIGYGVLLWEEPDSSLNADDLLTVYIDSNIRDTYTFTPYKQKNMMEIIRWRVKFFDKFNDAQEFSKKYDHYKTIYAKTMQNGLPVRQEPDPASDRVYRLRLGEIVKVLSREEKKSEVGQFNGYWYHILTKEGVQGYCFDVYLKVYDSLTYKEEEETILTPNLLTFFETKYVPDYYRNMIVNRAIDLDRFKLNYGLFPNLDTKTINIILEDFQKEYHFEEITSPSKDKYLFEGTDLKIQFIRSTYINVSFMNDGKEETRDFVVISDLDKIIDDEKTRREEILNNLLVPGNTLESSAYGKFMINEDGSFEWTGYERLIPAVIPGSYGSKGLLRFNYFLSDSLEKDYSGVISLYFTDSDKPVHFLFKAQDAGIQLTTLNGVDSRNKIFNRQSDDPVIIYFSYIRSGE